MAIEIEDLLVRIIRLEDFKKQTGIDISVINSKIDEEITEVKNMHRELKSNLEKISSTLVKIQYALLGGIFVIILSSIGITEFLQKFIKFAL